MAQSSGKPTSGGIPSMIERQMRNWEMLRQQGAKFKAKGPRCWEVLFYVTISRECGCGAEDVADKLVELTGFEKYDRELLDYMVSRDDVRRQLYETLDGQTISWIEDVLSGLSFSPSVNMEEYFNRLSHAVLAVCHNTHAIIIGRGANFILPRDCGVAVRLVAPINYRLENYARRMNLDLKTARADIEMTDKRRSQFIEHHFGKYAYDPRRYDLVINVAQFSPEKTAYIILEAIKAQAGSELKLPVGVVVPG